MKEKILEVQNYFADKLARGLYKVVKISNHTIEVIVDGKYNFHLWTANVPSNFDSWNYSGNFMRIKFTEEQKAAGYKIAAKHCKRWVNTELREKELKELAKLKEKYPEAE
jgi:hypothetical protein